VTVSFNPILEVSYPLSSRYCRNYPVSYDSKEEEGDCTAISSACIASGLMFGMKIKVMSAETNARPDPIQNTPCLLVDVFWTGDEQGY
jgi:hypothetical protein